LTLDTHPIDPREKALFEYYHRCDERGRNQILRVAEAESHYAREPNGDVEAA
jgi:hypothetical protein